MAVLRLTFIILLHCLLLINVNCEKDFNENLDEFYRPQIWSLVNSLNSDPNRVYNYNYATLIYAQNKDADSTDLTIDIEVDCRRPETNLCHTTVLVCQGTVKYNTDLASYESLPGTTCNPKVRVDLTRDDDFFAPETTSEEDRSEMPQTEIAQEETAQASSETDLFRAESTESYNNEPVAFRTSAPCLGCVQDLNPNVEGLGLLTDTALRHIESERTNKHVLVRVLRIQQQVVAGIKYILLLEVAPTVCAKTVDPSTADTCAIDTNAIPETCEVTYIQQPWISRKKQIISNNCTQSQEFSPVEEQTNSGSNDMDNEIDVNFNYKKTGGKTIDHPETGDNVPNYDSIADTGHADDILQMTGGGIMDSARMRDIESQIVYRSDVQTTEEIPVTEESSVLTDDQREALGDILDMFGDDPRVKRSTKDNNNDDDSSSSSSSSDEEEKQKKKSKKYSKHHDKNDDDDDDDDDDNNNNNNNKNNDDCSSSSSSSSSEEDNGNEIKKHKSKKSKRESPTPADDNKSSASSEETEEPKQKRSTPDNQSSSSEENDAQAQPINDKNDDSSSSSEENNDVKRSKRQVVSSESNETSEEKNDVTQPPVKQDNEIAAEIKQKETSEEDSSEEKAAIGGVRRKRSILNMNAGLVKISPDEKNFVNNLADFAVTTLDDIDADNHRRVVLQVLGAKKSVTDTITYYLTLRVGVSHCPEEQTPTTDLTRVYEVKNECRHRLLENLTKICKVQVSVNEDKSNPKVDKSHCQNIKKDQDDKDLNRTHRFKRGGIPGGVSDADISDPKIQQYASQILEELDAEDGEGPKRVLVTVVSAKKQVVAGIKYIFELRIKEKESEKTCNVEVWDQPWLKKKEVKLNCGEGTQPKKYQYVQSTRHVRADDHDIHVGLFKDFMRVHNKTYASKAEFKQRFRVFRQNMKTVKTLNDNEQGTAKYGATKFADLTKEEFKVYLGLKPALLNQNNIPFPDAAIPNIDLPTEFDWRTKGVVSEVKNQGQCGSCWAFSVTGNIEGQNAIKTGKLIELSEQELVDCDKLDDGCNGGLPDNAYRAIEQLGGLETESDYPYEAENEKCHFNKSLTKVQISGAVNISTDETNMAKWLTQNGPISIGINANAMQFYMGGVSHPWKFLCDPKNLDHGVLIVGYGVHKYPLFNKTLPYWIVKNSWGPTWGEQGYYRVYRGDGTCGVNQMASSAVI